MRGREGDRWCSVFVDKEGEGGARPPADTRLVRVQLVCPFITLKHHSLLLYHQSFCKEEDLMKEFKLDISLVQMSVIGIYWC